MWDLAAAVVEEGPTWVDLTGAVVPWLALLLSAFAVWLERRSYKKDSERERRLKAVEVDQAVLDRTEAAAFGWVAVALVDHPDGRRYWRLSNSGNGRVYGVEVAASSIETGGDETPDPQFVPTGLGAGEVVYIPAADRTGPDLEVVRQWNDVAGRISGHRDKTVVGRITAVPWH